MREPPSTIDIRVTVGSAPAEADLARWARRLLRASGAPRAGLSVLLCGDARMRRLNRTWRCKDRFTDVLSFPVPESERGAKASGFLGDVVVDVACAARQASRCGHGLDREVQILLAHGILHLLGQDHEVDGGEMFRLQARVVRRAFGRGPDGVPENEPAARKGGR